MNSVTKSIPQIINLIFLVLLVFFLYAIFFVQMLQGKYWHCDTDHFDLEHVTFDSICNKNLIQKFNIHKVTDKWACMDNGGDWIRDDSNYDDCF